MKARFINFRPTVILAIIFTLGVYCGYLFTNGRVYAIIPAILLLIFLVVFAILKKKNAIIFVSLCVLAISCGFANYFARYLVVAPKKENFDRVLISGYITKDSNQEYNYLVLQDVEIDNGGDKFKLDGNLSLYVYPFCHAYANSVEFEIGYKFECVGDVSSINIFKDGIDVYHYKQGVKYSANKIYVAKTMPANKGVIDSIRGYIKDSLYKYMDKEEASIALPLVLSDTSQMEQADKDAFRQGGISHILAVSGLHIGFLVAIISFILQKANVRKVKRFFLTIIPLLLYCCLIGFTPSVTRATVMCVVMLAVQLLGGQTDMLTSLAIASFVVLLIEPFYIFDCGFLLSVGAVFGIATFSNCTRRILKKYNVNKILNFVLTTIIISVGATLGTFFILTWFYGTVSFIGVLLNILIIPILSFGYWTIIVGLLPLPFIGYILFIPQTFIRLIRLLALWATKLPFSYAILPPLTSGVICFVLILLIYRGYFNFTLRQKSIILSVLSIVTIGLSVFDALPKQNVDAVYFYGEQANCVVATTKENNIYVLSDFISTKDIDILEKHCNRYKCNNLNLYIKNYSVASSRTIHAILSQFKVTNIYKISGNLNYEVDQTLKEFNQVACLQTNSNDVIRAIYYGDARQIMITVCKARILLADTYDFYPERLASVDAVFASNDANTIAKYYQNIPIFNPFDSGEYIFDTFQFGNFTIFINNGKLKIRL